MRRAASLGEKTVLLESEILENDGRIDAAIEVLTEYVLQMIIENSKQLE